MPAETSASFMYDWIIVSVCPAVSCTCCAIRFRSCSKSSFSFVIANSFFRFRNRYLNAAIITRNTEIAKPSGVMSKDGATNSSRYRALSTSGTSTDATTSFRASGCFFPILRYRTIAPESVYT